MVRGQAMWWRRMWTSVRGRNDATSELVIGDG